MSEKTLKSQVEETLGALASWMDAAQVLNEEYQDALKTESDAAVALTKIKEIRASEWLKAIARGEFDGCKNNDQRESAFYSTRSPLWVELSSSTKIAEITYGERKLAEARIDEVKALLRVLEMRMQSMTVLLRIEELGKLHAASAD